MAAKNTDPQTFSAEMLRDHNLVRQNHNVGALVWDESLAADASRYAQRLAAAKQFEHSESARGQPAQGENLWMGTRSAYAFREMTGAWIEEGQDFTRGTFPNISRSGSWEKVGHFTQMVWSETRKVGCAVAANTENDVLVCRYFPAGNVLGRNPLG